MEVRQEGFLLPGAVNQESPAAVAVVQPDPAVISREAQLLDQLNRLGDTESMLNSYCRGYRESYVKALFAFVFLGALGQLLAIGFFTKAIDVDNQLAAGFSDEFVTIILAMLAWTHHKKISALKKNDVILSALFQDEIQNIKNSPHESSVKNIIENLTSLNFVLEDDMTLRSLKTLINQRRTSLFADIETIRRQQPIIYYGEANQHLFRPAPLRPVPMRHVEIQVLNERAEGEPEMPNERPQGYGIRLSDFRRT